MTNLLKRYEILIQSSNGLFRKVSILALSSSHARTIAESLYVRNLNESVCSVFPSTFAY